MSLTVQDIQAAKDGQELFDLLSATLQELFPPEIQEDPDRFLIALGKAPRGLRAMAGMHPLDVSMSMDDLAWHFGNHNDERFLEETAAGLKELGAAEAAEIFAAAWNVMRPHLAEIRTKDWASEDFIDYLEKTGIQSKIDTLNERMWAICKQRGDLGLLSYWLDYARKYPENCVTAF